MSPRTSPVIFTAALIASLAACGGPESEGGQTNATLPVAGRPTGDDTAADADRSCWSDRDCRRGQICSGERICPPGALCGALPDIPGTCTDPAIGCEYEGRRYPPGAVFGPCRACSCQRDGSVACQDFACLECRSDQECPEGYACERAFDCPPDALCRPVLEAPGYCTPVDPGSTSECGPDECGPAPAMPNRLCEDGVHYSGPSGRCVRGDDGLCGHEILSCPPCSEAGCAAGQLCLRTLGGAADAEVSERCIDASRYLVCDGSEPSCGCLDLGSICPADPTCDEADGRLLLTCTYR